MPGCRRCASAVRWSAADLAALVREGFSPAAPHDRRDPRESRRVSAVAGREPPAAVARHAGVSPAPRRDCVAAPAPADEDESDAGERADEAAAPAPGPQMTTRARLAGDGTARRALIGPDSHFAAPRSAWLSGSVACSTGVSSRGDPHGRVAVGRGPATPSVSRPRRR